MARAGASAPSHATARRGHASLQRGQLGRRARRRASRSPPTGPTGHVEVVVVDDGSHRRREPGRPGRGRRPAPRPGRAPGQRRTVRGAPGGPRGLSRPTYVLLLDARVEVAPSRSADPARPSTEATTVWNYDVVPGSRDLRALFWTGITKVWWRDYFRTRRLIAFGLDDFDRYPKGTGAFFAPAACCSRRPASSSSHFADASPGLRRHPPAARGRRGRGHRPLARGAVHPPRQERVGGSWSRQCYYRGTTFVDGYLGYCDRAQGFPDRPGGDRRGRGRARSGSAAHRCCRCRARAPRHGVGGTRWAGGTPREAVAVGLLTPGFGVTFGAGVLRGLRMATGRRDR